MIPAKAENNIQAIDQALNTEKITPKLVQYIVDKIVREIQPVKIILFGSYARGDFSRDSDLDLFIVYCSRRRERIQSFNLLFVGLPAFNPFMQMISCRKWEKKVD